jgi:ribosomal-protein-alanine N-acetyltransferase
MTALPAVTRAGAAHPTAMAAVHAACFPAGEAWDVAVMAAELSMPGVFGFVAEVGGMILARAVAGEAEILTLAVHPAARRRGLARALVEAVAAHASRAGATRLFLEVSVANQAARALYSGAGFAQVGTRRRYYPDGSDALVLSRGLRPGPVEADSARKPRGFHPLDP